MFLLNVSQENTIIAQEVRISRIAWLVYPDGIAQVHIYLGIFLPQVGRFPVQHNFSIFFY